MVHVVIPQELVSQIDSLVGQRGRSRFLVDAASRELKRLRQIKALKRAAGSWKSMGRVELEAGAAEWVRALRKQDEKRFK